MQDVIASLVGLLLLGPLETRLAEKLQAAHVPQGIAAQVLDCARTAAPTVVDRVTADPLWAAQAAMRVWIGTTTADAVLADAAPVCRPALDAAQSFLSERGA